MSLPFGHVDTAFERLLQELPADFRKPALAVKAFSRSRNIKTPEQLLQVVLSDCGIDPVLHNPPDLNRYDTTRARIDWYQELQRIAETEQRVPVWIQAKDQFIKGSVTARAARPRGGYGNYCTRNWLPPSAV